MKLKFTILIVFGIVLNTLLALDLDRSPPKREFDDSKIKAYQLTSDFVYTKKSAKVNLWDGFFEWLAEKLEDLFDDKDAEFIGKFAYIIIRVLLWVIIIFAVGTIVYSLYKNGAFGVFGRKHKSVNISSDDFHILQSNPEWDELIKDAVDKGKFNQAIRLLYLRMLYLLGDSNQIEIIESKSIRDYQQELPSEFIKQFTTLSRYYQYAWFGGVTIDDEQFKEVHREFINFNVVADVE